MCRPVADGAYCRRPVAALDACADDPTGIDLAAAEHDGGELALRAQLSDMLYGDTVAHVLEAGVPTTGGETGAVLNGHS